MKTYSKDTKKLLLIRSIAYIIFFVLVLIETVLHNADFIRVLNPFGITLLIFLITKLKKPNLYLIALLTIIMGMASDSVLKMIFIVFLLYHFIVYLNIALPLEYFLKDFVMIFLVTLVYLLLVKTFYLGGEHYFNYTGILVFIKQVICSSIYMYIIKKLEVYLIKR